VNVVGPRRASSALPRRSIWFPEFVGLCQGSVHPHRTGIEAGLSAVGAIFESIASRAGTDVAVLSQGLKDYRAGQTGLLRMTWDNGDRNPAQIRIHEHSTVSVVPCHAQKSGLFRRDSP